MMKKIFMLAVLMISAAGFGQSFSVLDMEMLAGGNYQNFKKAVENKDYSYLERTDLGRGGASELFQYNKQSAVKNQIGYERSASEKNPVIRWETDSRDDFYEFENQLKTAGYEKTGKNSGRNSSSVVYTKGKNSMILSSSLNQNSEKPKYSISAVIR
ncbi:MAG: hypothetical protein H3C39_05510 [Flavobacteriia bacterium]|nr:hypothetical protein [Flavobacteriia bacterium]